MQIRQSNDRGHARFDWLDSRHTFSFGQYFDPKHMGFGALRVINDDRVDAGAGFPPHGHADMEIISYVVEGALRHEDSMGNGSTIVPGDVQRMSAGTGVQHSEYNDSTDDSVRFLQIWIVPEKRGISPGYEQKRFFTNASDTGTLKLVASRDAREGSLKIHQDVDMYAARLDIDDPAQDFTLREGRKAWIQIVKGELTINETKFQEGDGVSFENGEALKFAAQDDVEFIVFDIA